MALKLAHVDGVMLGREAYYNSYVKSRFAIIATDVMQVIPITSNTTNVYPCECLIETPHKMAKALGGQIVTLDKSRVKSFISKVSLKEMRQLEKVIMLQLGLKKYF